jgi:hypothetical protein
MRGDTLLTSLECLCSCIAKPEFQHEKKGGILLTESQIYGCFSAERQRAPRSQGIAGMPREEGVSFIVRYSLYVIHPEKSDCRAEAK